MIHCASPAFANRPTPGDGFGVAAASNRIRSCDPTAARRGFTNANELNDMSSPQTPAEQELAELIVGSLNLEQVEAKKIDPEAPLFGGDLGLDSIDALELALAVSKRYGFQLRSDNSDNHRIFSSLRALSAHIQQHRTG